MEDSDPDGTETEPLVNKSSDKCKRAPLPPPPFPSSYSLLKAESPLNATPPYHPPPPPPKPSKDGSKKGSTLSSSTWKAHHDLSPTLRTLQETNEEPTLEEVYLPERRQHSSRIQHGTAQAGSSYILCPLFGVRNYLQYFYEKPKAPGNMAPPREDLYMIKGREGFCSSSIFRLSLLLGGIILLMGTTAFIVAVCASRRTPLIRKMGGIPVEDRVAAVHNAEVDALLLVGLIAVTLGATIVASALISQAFCTTPNYDETFRENLWAGQRTTVYEYPHWIYSMERRVPATEELTQIQPSTHTGVPLSLHPHK